MKRLQASRGKIKRKYMNTRRKASAKKPPERLLSYANWRKLLKYTATLVVSFTVYCSFHKSAHPQDIYVGPPMRGLQTTAVPARRSVFLHIDLTGKDLTETTLDVQIRDADGIKLFEGVGYRRQNKMLDIQVPAIEKAGSCVLQVYNGNEEVSESVLKVENVGTRVDIKDIAPFLLRLMVSVHT